MSRPSWTPTSSLPLSPALSNPILGISETPPLASPTLSCIWAPTDPVLVSFGNCAGDSESGWRREPRGVVAGVVWGGGLCDLGGSFFFILENPTLTGVCSVLPRLSEPRGGLHSLPPVG